MALPSPSPSYFSHATATASSTLCNTARAPSESAYWILPAERAGSRLRTFDGDEERDEHFGNARDVALHDDAVFGEERVGSTRRGGKQAEATAWGATKWGEFNGGEGRRRRRMYYYCGGDASGVRRKEREREEKSRRKTPGAAHLTGWIAPTGSRHSLPLRRGQRHAHAFTARPGPQRCLDAPGSPAPPSFAARREYARGERGRRARRPSTNLGLRSILQLYGWCLRARWEQVAAALLLNTDATEEELDAHVGFVEAAAGGGDEVDTTASDEGIDAGIEAEEDGHGVDAEGVRAGWHNAEPEPSRNEYKISSKSQKLLKHQPRGVAEVWRGHESEPACDEPHGDSSASRSVD
ncbi:hypothetical protein B0H16DRAFT_1448563 [Mycena metata]|uniref:Uncharacterized protein n=1 Tax=Mycena metata TaxID=1033252 RepID=A0AAD7K7X7_9AGAR|nr:hypothetical protein B0H16DRAFT_1448563 [Mycena metata]